MKWYKCRGQPRNGTLDPHPSHPPFPPRSLPLSPTSSIFASHHQPEILIPARNKESQATRKILCNHSLCFKPKQPHSTTTRTLPPSLEVTVSPSTDRSYHATLSCSTPSTTSLPRRSDTPRLRVGLGSIGSRVAPESLSLTEYSSMSFCQELAHCSSMKIKFLPSATASSI